MIILYYHLLLQQNMGWEGQQSRVHELAKGLEHQTSMEVVGSFEVLALRVFGLGEVQLAVEASEGCLETLCEAKEVFAVELRGEYPAIGGYEGLVLACLATGEQDEILGHGGYVISMVLGEKEFWNVGDSTQERILFQQLQIVLNGLNTIYSLQFHYLSTEVLRQQLMTETNSNQFEVFIEMICLEDVIEGILDDGWRIIANVISTSREDDATIGQQILQRWSLMLDQFEDPPLFIVVQVAKEESRGVEMRLQDVARSWSIGYDTDFILGPIYQRQPKQQSASLVMILYLFLVVHSLKQFVQIFMTRQILSWNFHKERILMIDAVIVDDKVHDVASPSSIKRMITFGIISKSLIELDSAVEVRSDVGRPQFRKMIENET